MLTKEHFGALVDHSPDIFCVLNDDATITYINTAIRADLGQAPSRLIGQNIDTLVSADDVERLKNSFEQKSSPEVIHFLHHNGTVVPFEVLIQKTDPQIGSFLLCARNIATRQTALDASGSQEKYLRLFEESRDAICIGTVTGKLLDANPAAVKLFGCRSKEELLSLDIARDLYWNPEDRQRIESVFTHQGFVEDVEIELKTLQGERLRVQETASAIYDDAGAVLGFRAILRDVTQNRRLEEQLRQSQKMDAIGRLAGGIAHDFNNLLTAINGYSELTLARMPEDDPLHTALQEIRKAGKRAAELTRRLLTLSRHQKVSPRSLNLNLVVTEMEKLLHRVLGTDIELVTIPDPAAAKIFADISQIEQILLNLAVNARDAMPHGGRLEIETQRTDLPNGLALPVVLKPGLYTQLTIRDTGTGIEDGIKEHIFEPFYTTKERDHNTGLGLSIVYGIVRQNHGAIHVENTESGSAFQIYLPAATDSTAINFPAEPTSTIDMPRGRETILLVEDESSVRSLVRKILQLQGYRVLTANNAQQALELCNEMNGRPDLLLTDIVMPERSGTALAQDLQRRYSDLKILFMSGYTDSHVGVKLVTEQRAAFLPKPFSPDVLANKVRHVLDKPN